MKKQLFIFLLALLPFVASAQTDRVFELFGYTKFKIGDMTLDYTKADGLLVNGKAITAEQAVTLLSTLQNRTDAAPTSAAVKTVTDALSTLISNQALTITTQGSTITALKDTVAAQRTYIGKLSIDTANAFLNAQIVRKATQLYQSFNNGTYFAPTAINFGTISSTSIQPILTPVTGATSYTLKRNGDVINVLDPSNLAYTDRDLNPATAYTYSATVTDGTKISMPVTASATTLANIAVSNSTPSPGYTVTQFINFPDLTKSSDPSTSIKSGHEIGNANFVLYSTDGDFISITPTFSSSAISNIKIYLPAGFTGRYKLTLYNVNSDANPLFNIGNTNSGNSTDGSIVNGNYVATAQGNGSPDSFLFLNGSTLSFSAFKLEVQN